MKNADGPEEREEFYREEFERAFDEIFREEDLAETLLDIARTRIESFECNWCDGTGLRTVHGGGNGYPEWDADDQPCPECNPGYSRVQPT